MKKILSLVLTLSFVAALLGGFAATEVKAAESYALYFDTDQGKLLKAAVVDGDVSFIGEYTGQSGKWSILGNTLTLNGFNFETTTMMALNLPEDAKVVIADGSTNTIKTTATEAGMAIICMGNLEISKPSSGKGTGVLNLSAVNAKIAAAINTNGTLTVNGITLNATAGKQGVSLNGAGIAAMVLVAQNATINATFNSVTDESEVFGAALLLRNTDDPTVENDFINSVITLKSTVRAYQSESSTISETAVVATGSTNLNAKESDYSNSLELKPVVFEATTYQEYFIGDKLAKVVKLQPPYTAVTNITNVPKQVYVSDTLKLSGTIVPTAATNSTITWKLKDAGTTGAKLRSGKLTFTNSGTVKVQATIKNGKTRTSDYTKNFTIKVTYQPSKSQTYSISGLNYKVTANNDPSAIEVTVTGLAKEKKNATTLTIPKTVKIKGNTCKVTSIAERAFDKCRTLKTITIGDNVKVINKRAFTKCSSLESITIGKGLTELKSHAFCGSRNLKTITIKSTKLNTVGNLHTFNSVGATVKVPETKIKAYKKLFEIQDNTGIKFKRI